jgi:7-cyano-7-deazaguanine reductase
MNVLDNTAVSKVLGQVVDYPDQYDPSILVREPRQNNRKTIDLDDNNLPFVGFDTWNCYEVSTLNENGLPIVGTLKIVYPCDSEFIVESKSIKLYLNSFNMYRCPGWGYKFVVEYVTGIIQRDLSELLQTDVQVHFNGNTDTDTSGVFDLKSYTTLETFLDIDRVQFDVYNESPDLLVEAPSELDDEYSVARFYHSALLKSNCRVTSQPDWGDVYIYMNSSRVVDPLSLLKYIISFRDECHFHEEICETIYKRLTDAFTPKALAVTCLYTRRGGIDINPSRASHEMFLPQSLINPEIPHCKTLKQ